MTIESSPMPASVSEAGEGRMRAVVRARYGLPDVLEVADADVPSPKRREVLVEVGAASVHPGDAFVMAGRPVLVRLVFGLRRPRHPTPGMDLAGVVAAVGADVTSLRVGDRVFGWTGRGALAEYAVVREDHLAPIPENVTVEQAAVAPTSGMAALQALRDVAGIRSGQRLLVVGASGGVGSFAVQIGKAYGAEVTGVCSTANTELVRSLGADNVIAYDACDVTASTARFDVILDNVEAQPLAAMRRLLSPTGTLIPNSGHGGRWVGPLGRIIAARLRSAFTRQRLKPFTSLGTRDHLLAVAELLRRGQVTPVIGDVFAFEDAADALRQVATGHTRGKVVIAVRRHASHTTTK